MKLKKIAFVPLCVVLAGLWVGCGKGLPNLKKTTATTGGGGTPPPTGPVHLIEPNAKLAVGHLHSCLVVTGGHVKCWGSNNEGQLGLEAATNDHRGDAAGEMAALTTVDFGTVNGNGTGGALTVKQIDAGNYFNCVVLSNDRVKCWGSNGGGELGLGDTVRRGDDQIGSEMGDSLAYVDLGTVNGNGTGGPITVRQVAAGGEFACARTTDDRVKCWGTNLAGQLGLGNTDWRGTGWGAVNAMGDDLPYVDLGTGRTARQIATGEDHVCAILDNDTVKCWGSGGQGQLGNESGNAAGANAGEMGDVLPTVNFGTSGGQALRAKQLSLGAYYSCALLTDDSVKCWGSNGDAELGQDHDDGSVGNQANQMGNSLPAINFGAGKTVKRIASVIHSCAIMNDDSVMCWGRGNSGCLGSMDQTATGNSGRAVGSMPSVNLGTVNGNGTGGNNTVTEVMVGALHSCALLSSGSVKCWGGNVRGQLGQGDTVDRGDSNAAGHELGDDLPVIGGL